MTILVDYGFYVVILLLFCFLEFEDTEHANLSLRPLLPSSS